ncbi:hypothetical protein ACH3XW_24195 [Acanthocheilonema viteae]
MTHVTAAPAKTLKVITLAPQYQPEISSIQTNNSLNCTLQCSQNCTTNCHRNNDACKLIYQQNCAKICGDQALLPISQSIINHPAIKTVQTVASHHAFPGIVH